MITQNWFKTLADSAASNDGAAVKFTIYTERGKPLRVDMTTRQVEELIRHLIQLSEAAGRNREQSPGLSVGDQADVAPITASNVAALPGAKGEAVFVFRLGTLDLAFSVPAKRVSDLGAELSALGRSME